MPSSAGPSAQKNLWEAELQAAFRRTRYYDFRVYSRKTTLEKLRLHASQSSEAGLVVSPEQWRWSSYRFHCWGEKDTVKIG